MAGVDPKARPVFRRSDWGNLELVRQIVLYRLKHDSNWTQFDYSWDGYASNYVQFDPPEVRSRFVVLVNEVMWQLLVQGVITARLNASDPSLPHFRITDYGQKVLQAGRFIAHDAAGYLNDLRAVTGPIDTSVATAYVEEALNCFNSGCHVASVLLLGVAAESVFEHMSDIIRAALTDSNERKNLDPRSPVKARHRWVVQKYQDLPSTVRRDVLAESLDMTLTSLHDLIRRQRNELGHPQDKPPKMDREEAFVFFHLFPEFVSDAQAFAGYCQQNGI